MATTVRVETKVKANLDRLQGLVQSETGRRLSHSELLAKLLQFVGRRPTNFLKELDKEWEPPTPQEIKRLYSKVRDWGVRTDVSKIDETLYGGATS